MSSFIQHFLPNCQRKTLMKPRFVAIEEDWEFVRNVFPEPGFTSYFLGHIVSKLAEELKQHGVTSYYERAERPDLANLPRFLSNIRLTREANHPDVGRGVGSTCATAAQREGESTAATQSAGGETQGGSQVEGGEGAKPEPARLALQQHLDEVLGFTNKTL